MGRKGYNALTFFTVDVMAHLRRGTANFYGFGKTDAIRIRQ